MATLIQSKQIEGVVTASVIEGNFSVQGQIIATGSDSIFGSITASSISSSGPIYGVRYSDIQGTPSFIGGTGINITQVGNTITITNTGTGGGVSGSAELISSVAQLNSYTGSNDIIILGLQSQIDALIAQTGSYETKGSGIISGSSQLTASFDSRYALSGSSVVVQIQLYLILHQFHQMKVIYGGNLMMVTFMSIMMGIGLFQLVLLLLFLHHQYHQERFLVHLN